MWPSPCSIDPEFHPTPPRPAASPLKSFWCQIHRNDATPRTTPARRLAHPPESPPPPQIRPPPESDHKQSPASSLDVRPPPSQSAPPPRSSSSVLSPSEPSVNNVYPTCPGSLRWTNRVVASSRAFRPTSLWSSPVLA